MSNVDEFLEDRWPQNFCLGEAQCALGSEQLKSVIANNEILIEQDRKIREWLKDVPEITFPGIVEGGRYVVHQYIMHYDGSKYGKNRNDLLDLLTQKYGVRAIVQYYPLYRYPLFQKRAAARTTARCWTPGGTTVSRSRGGAVSTTRACASCAKASSMR